MYLRGLPCGSDGKDSACNARELGSIPGLGRSPGGGQYTLSILAGYSPWDLKESDTTEQISTSHIFRKQYIHTHTHTYIYTHTYIHTNLGLGMDHKNKHIHFMGYIQST